MIRHQDAILKDFVVNKVSQVQHVFDLGPFVVINSLKMVPWCRNMLELVHDRKCVLCYVLLCFN